MNRTSKTGQILAVGLMSGTSLDGIDAALIETDGGTNVRARRGYYMAYEPGFRAALHAAASGDVPLSDLLRLEKELTEKHAAAVRALLKVSEVHRDKVAVIGFHGQTIRHIPAEGLTWQLGNPSLLAEQTGIPVVGDFRRRDMAAGGEGAPLAPLYHATLFGQAAKPCGVLNIGGVANLTWLGPNGAVVATDTGPGNALLDAWVSAKAGQPYDAHGKLSARGKVDETVVKKALELPFFSRKLPRSADRYDFDKVDVSHLSVEDGAATLCAVTAASIKATLDKMPAPVKALWVSGGGARNPVLMSMLKKHVPDTRDAKDAGLRPDYMEAECFAWLAVRRLREQSTSLPETTGASKPTSGGVLTA